LTDYRSRAYIIHKFVAQRTWHASFPTLIFHNFTAY